MCERLRIPLPSSAAPHVDTLPQSSDKQIRAQLRRFLSRKYANDPETTIVEELGLYHGYCRVDLAVINGSLHGFEIKSDRDTFRRLARQAETYNKIFDFVTLVVGERHAQEAVCISPQWWGIQFAEQHWRDGVGLMQVREPVENPSPDNLAIAKLLWREEALTLLEQLGAADGLRSRPRKFVYSRLAEVAAIDKVRSYVRDRLRSRKDWRSDERQMSSGG
jgi:hypothetical protein